jgi:excisionase family DNA binding protein
MTETPGREILNIEEAAELLGVSVKTFNKVLHSESLPGRKFGREWKFSRQALIDWIGAGRSDALPRSARDQAGRERPGPGPSEPPGARRTSGWRAQSTCVEPEFACISAVPPPGVALLAVAPIRGRRRA